MTVSVKAKADIFYSGLSALPATPLTNGGNFPVLVTLPAGAHRVLTISSATGTLSWGGGSQFTADGDPTGESTNLNGVGGISGIKVDKGRLFLAGVFLTSSDPSGAPAPATLHLASPSAKATLAPALQQVFPIGDGHTASGSVQQFVVPAGATRLYLGFADGYFFSGTPSSYNDNSGTTHVTLAVSH